ncbi:MAG: hypothetical protein ABIQ35_14640, partial [Verrucomicrobiota bacterium]
QFLFSPQRISGIVKAIVPDDAGGWFIGGTFTRIGDVAITNIARLNSDLSLDTRWNAGMVGSTVNALILESGRLYIGGQFSRINGQTIGNLAGVNASNASVAWNPQLAGTVNAIRIDAGLLYAGGSFFSVGSSNVQNLAAISTTTALATSWNPAPDQAVLALEVSGNTVYAGGNFSTIGTRPRNRLASVDATTGIAFQTWNPNPNGIIRAISVVGSTVYVGGDFTTVSAQNRRGFAALNSGNGAAQALNLQLESATTANLVRSILIQGNSLYVSGLFTNALGAPHLMVVGIDIPSVTVLPVPLASDFNGTAGAAFGANALAVANGRVLIGGDFFSFGGVARQRAAALSLITGAALPWAPKFSAPVLTMAYGTNRIYVGGSFTNVNTTNFAQGLVAVDPIVGDLTPFNFLGTNVSQNTSIRSLIISSNTLYVGGDFTIVGSQPRRFVATVDPATAVPNAGFNARLGGGFSGINAMVLAGTNLYLAGDFTTVNSLAIPRLAAVSRTDGTNVNWTPNPNQPPNALAASPETLYVGGLFSQIGGVALKNFAAFSLADNLLLGVDAALPPFAGGVTAIGASPVTLYVGGSFDSIGGEFRLNLACLASFNASAYEWDPAPDQPPTVITLTEETAFIGGPFRFLGRAPTNTINSFLAVFSRAPQFIQRSLSPNNIHLVTTTGDRTDAVLQAATDLAGPWVSIATNDIPGFRWTVDYPTISPLQRFFRTVAR